MAIELIRPASPTFVQIGKAPSSLSGRASKAVPPVAYKVSNSPVLFALGAIALCFLAVINSFWTSIVRVVSYYNHKSFYDGVEKAQIKKLSEGLDLVVEPKNLGLKAQFEQSGLTIGSFSETDLKANILEQLGSGADERSAARMAKKVIQIRKMVEHLKKNGSSLLIDPTTVRDALSDVMGMHIFRKLASNEDCVAVNFLQFLAVKLVSADANDALRDYGMQCLGSELFEEQPGRTFRPDELADHLIRYLQRPSFNVDSFGPLKEGRFIWAVAHPGKAMHALYSNTHPLKYKSTQANPYLSAHQFKEGGKTTTFYYGPGPTGDPLFEYGVLPAYKKFGSFELRFNHQNTSNRGDYARIQDSVRMANDQLLHAVIGFDKKGAKHLCKNFTSAQDFFTSYRVYVKNGLREIQDRKNDNGFYIPAELFDDSQVALALNKAEEFCQNMSANNPRWQNAVNDKHGKARMATMMMLVADTFLALGMLYGSFDRITSDMVENSLNEKLDQDLAAIRISGCCKQDVDRAVIENISLRLFFRWANDPAPLTSDEVCEIAGAVFGRARIVDDRNIQMRRYIILDDLLRFVGGHPDGVLTAHSVLSQYRDSLSNLKYAHIPGSSYIMTPVAWLKRKVFASH